MIFNGACTLFTILSLVSCSKNGNGLNYNTNSNTISIANMAFSPSSANVTSGTTVTWTNNDAMVHTVTADDNSFTSGSLNKGDSYSHTFNAAGTVDYHCTIHPGMKANIIVK